MLVSTRYADVDDPSINRSSSSEDALGQRELLEEALDASDDWTLTRPEPDVESLWNLLFTSGTSSAPKAVRCTQRRLLTTGNRLSMVLDVGPDDVGYIAMPLFHSNSLMVGLAPALVVGASVGLARKFSASRFLDDVRRYGATWFNYTGKPLAYLLATPEKPDDADNTLRLAYGNEGSPQVVETVSRALRTSRWSTCSDRPRGRSHSTAPADPPRGSIGALREDVAIVDPDGNPVPVAEFDADGRLTNADVCVGEIVNTAGVGPFEGYYKNEEAMAATTRNGWYWSGDLGYIDADGWVYFAGRTADWLRVDGENFPAGPIDAVVDPASGRLARRGLRGARRLRRRSGDGRAGAARGHGVRPGRIRPLARAAARPVAQVAPAVREDRRVAAADPVEQGAHPGPPAREVPVATGPAGDPIYLRGAARRRTTLMTPGEEAELRGRFDNEGRLRVWDL